MQCNAPPDRTNITRSFLENENIPTLEWPSVSLDMYPMENVWRQTKNSDKIFEIVCDILEELAGHAQDTDHSNVHILDCN